MDYHRLLNQRPFDHRKIEIANARIRELNEQLTPIEEEFSSVLGAGSRWLENIVISLLFFAVLLVESIGIGLTFFTSRSLSRGLADLTSAAERIGKGDFKARVKPSSRDEIGMHADARK